MDYPGDDISLCKQQDLRPFIGNIFRFFGVQHGGFRREFATENGCVFGEFV